MVEISWALKFMVNLNFGIYTLDGHGETFYEQNGEPQRAKPDYASQRNDDDDDGIKIWRLNFG